MIGETNLTKLLAAMSPQLMDGDYVFCSFENANYGEHANLEPIAAMVEAEGLTLVVPKDKADQKGIGYESVFAGITLTIHSSLDAVGLTAAISAKLTEYGISANVVAGYYHDHLFVQTQYADKAMDALKEFSAKKN